MSFTRIVTDQRAFFNSGATRSLSFRLEQLIKLKSLIEKNESRILDALYLDLHKHQNEAYMTEIALVLDELSLAIKNLNVWARPTSVTTPFMLWPGQSTIHREPYGVTLIISPWNFPFLITIQPLIGAIAAGNCAIIKPSELSTNTEKLLIDLINQHFPANYLHVIHADASQTAVLLKEQFDYIFFTGSERIGKVVMTAAAQHLTPLTLELGGKNPCIVDESANIKLAAREIMWAKTLNAGQVCIAPDYLLVHRQLKAALITEMRNSLAKFYGEQPKKSTSYGRIINQSQFNRLIKLLSSGKILHGGDTDASERYIAPTLIDEVTWHDPIMQDEIFGPILPIFTFDCIDEMMTLIQNRPKPLALYLFTTNSINEEKIINSLSFGCGAINTCILQIANPHLPFGGIGASGLGQYHGRYTFETFSHQKSLYKKGPIIDITPHQPPHTKHKFWWLKKLI